MGINILEIWVKFSPDQSKRVLECRFTISAIVVSATKISVWIKVRRHRTASITFEKMKKESISWRKVVWRRHSMLIKKKHLVHKPTRLKSRYCTVKVYISFRNLWMDQCPCIRNGERGRSVVEHDFCHLQAHFTSA